MKTPDTLLQQLDAIRVQLSRSAEDIRDAEINAGEAERDYKRESALAYRRATGSIDDRKQQAILDCEEFAKQRDRTAAVVNYLKMRRSNLEIEQSNLQTQARLVDLALGRSAR
jgi:hypothetical protein